MDFCWKYAIDDFSQFQDIEPRFVTMNEAVYKRQNEIDGLFASSAVFFSSEIA